MTVTSVSQLTHNISINKDYLGSSRLHMDAAQGKTQQELGCKGTTEQSERTRRMRSQGFQGCQGNTGIISCHADGQGSTVLESGKAGFIVSC